MSRKAAILASASLALLMLQCRVNQRIAYESPGDPGELITETSVPEAGAVTFCPSNKCPDGHATCPGSSYSCDVNLRTDPNNCGACGVQCPKIERPPNGIFTDPHEAAVQFDCVNGRCVLSCTQRIAMDCDGIVDNGCETLPSEPNNCGACGNVCSDPQKPCQLQPDGSSYACGCPAGMGLCGGFFGCQQLEGNDLHCGGCFKACNPNGDGGTKPTNAYYGCVGTECGHLKCNGGYGNCDDDMANGCETALVTNEHCGACNNACAPGQSCLYDKEASAYKCLCPPGRTYCDGRCVDLATDDTNCGTCGNVCSQPGGRMYLGYCSRGTCEWQCAAGRADCNGNSDDGCEVNTMSDPQNCGGCGIVCDGIAGQACAGGRCVVEPCEKDAGVTAR